MTRQFAPPNKIVFGARVKLINILNGIMIAGPDD